MPRRSVLFLALLALLATGCGTTQDQGDSTSPTTAQQRSPAHSTRGVVTVVARLKKCLRDKANAKLKREPPTLKDRIAIGAAGNVPATYVGAVVWPNDAFMDVWVADDAAHGARTADMLNKAEADAQGVSEVEAAFSNGRAVGAPENNPDKFGNLSQKETTGADDCLKATNG
jgi:hypothetical protein